MNAALLDQIVQAVLHEGYILYPYRATSQKNSRQRFTFGRVYPQVYSAAQRGAEPCLMQTQCLVQAPGGSPSLDISVRFLQAVWREVGALEVPCSALSAVPASAFRIMPELTVNGTYYCTWQEARERTVRFSPATSLENVPFAFPAECTREPLRDPQGQIVGALIRRSESLTGVVEFAAETLASDKVRITVRILNQSEVPPAKLEDEDAVLRHTLASTHTVLAVQRGEFISAMDPPPDCAALAATCKNIGTWPVLVGDKKTGPRDLMLSSPIILYDYPSIAAESTGSFFDGTEIDEMLALRVLTMTNTEKHEMRHVDEFARGILERTEKLGNEEFLRMHGAMREVNAAEAFNPTRRVQSVSLNGVELMPGARVRLRPKRRADALDLLLTGKAAVIEAVEQDAENRIHLAVVVEDDPGKDLGWMRQPGHRFFYGLEDVEPLQEASA